MRKTSIANVVVRQFAFFYTHYVKRNTIFVRVLWLRGESDFAYTYSQVVNTKVVDSGDMCCHTHTFPSVRHACLRNAIM